jgi:hypothetical protein
VIQKEQIQAGNLEGTFQFCWVKKDKERQKKLHNSFGYKATLISSYLLYFFVEML